MVRLKIDLPNDFFQEDIRCGYTVTKKMKEVWAVELDLLQELLRICDKYGLRCYADAGTLLGAVRHKGFIPWDDDIDVVMFRDDYEKLEQIADLEFMEPYFFQTAYTDEKYIYGHAQLRNINTTAILEGQMDKRMPFVQGIFIDIFILDGVLQNRYLLFLQHRLISLLDKLIRCRVTEKKYMKWRSKLANSILSVFGINYRTLYKGREWLLKRGNIQACTEVAPLGFIFETEKRIRNKALYAEIVQLDFENIKIPAPAGYDEFLHRRYGEYMELKQIPTTHGGVIFDVDKPYTEYL